MAGVRCKRFELGIKRALDVVASASILVALSPLLLLTALAIMLETNGPVFSRRRSIRVVRFRTGETHVGRMLRRTGLDRLPKLFNVLRSDLSIIGPRCQVDTLPSLVPDVVVDPLYENVFRPGLISLKLADELANPIVGQSEADLYYVSHWSLWFDVKILFLHLLSKETYL